MSAPKFVKSGYVERLTQNLPVWSVGVYPYEEYSDGSIIVYNPHEKFPTRKFTYWAGELIGRFWRIIDSEQQKHPKTQEDALRFIFKSRNVSIEKEADEAVAGLMALIMKHDKLDKTHVVRPQMNGTASLLSKELKLRGFRSDVLSNSSREDPVVRVSLILP